MSKINEKPLIIISGCVIGLISALLVLLGNPANMGFCIACFLRDTAGALRLHTAGAVQYIRPEIIGLVLGSLIISVSTKEFKAKGGSSPLTRFILGFFVTIGALMFLGCPLRMVLRLAGGDFNAILGLVGFIIGIVIGIAFLKAGFSLGRTHEMKESEGRLISWIQVVLFILLLVGGTIMIGAGENAKSLISFSKEGAGPGALHANIWISLIAGLIVGILAQRSRICMVGGIRDIILFKDVKLILGFISILISCLVVNVIIGKFHPGFVISAATETAKAVSQPVAHTEHLWNALGMVLVGFASVLLGGCPLRQLILAGEGNVDSAITVFGLICGAAFAHNFSLASSGAGSTKLGRIAVIIGIVVTAIIGFVNIKKINRS